MEALEIVLEVENWEPLSDDELDPVLFELVNVDHPDGPVSPTNSVDSGVADVQVDDDFADLSADDAARTFVTFSAEEREEFILFLKYTLEYGYYIPGSNSVQAT